MWFMALFAPLAAAEGCEQVGLRALADLTAPAVVVLGERRGTQPDLYRANRVVGALAKRGPVRLAIEAVPSGHQAVLDRFSQGELEPAALEAGLEWSAHWGYPYAPYAPLLRRALQGVEVVGVGLEGHPTQENVPIPAGYASVLRDGMAGHEVSPQAERDVVRYMAALDHALAENALKSWDGQGFLVILVDRTHVEGGKGVSWQVAALTEAPVRAITLAWGDPPCFPGDLVWRPAFYDSDRIWTRQPPP